MVDKDKNKNKNQDQDQDQDHGQDYEQKKYNALEDHEEDFFEDEEDKTELFEEEYPELLEQPAKSSMLEFVKTNWIVVGIGSLVIIYGSYQLIKGFWGSKAPVVKQEVRTGLFSQTESKIDQQPPKASTAPAAPVSPAAPTNPSIPELPMPQAPQAPAVPAPSVAPAVAQTNSATEIKPTLPEIQLGQSNTDQRQDQNKLSDIQTKEWYAKLDALNSKVERLTQLTSKMEILDNIEDKLKKIDAQISKLELSSEKVTQIDNLNNNLNKIYQYVVNLGKAVNQLAVQVNKQQVELSSLVRGTVGESVARDSEQAGLKIEAIIPGRAWILHRDGNRQTVTVGDQIPGYGEVVEINADKSQVVTSSGKVLRQ